MNSQGFLGIDISKGYADFLLLDENSKVLEEGFRLSDTKAGRQKLKELIEGWQAQGLKELRCGVESTGGYENNWHFFLKGLQSHGSVYVSRLNAKAVKSVSDAFLRRTITDAVSAENIASYLIKFPKKVDYGKQYVPMAGFTEGRQHLCCIKMLQKQKVQSSNQLEKLLYQYFPEIMIYCRHGMPLWLLKMLVKYPTSALVVKAGKRLSNVPGISQSKAQSLITKSKESEQKVSEQIAHVIVTIVNEVLHKESILVREKQYLTSMYQNSEEAQLLVSMTGVGIGSAVIAALEIEDVNRFETSKKMTSYFGVHPTYKQSGDGIWGNHMSKKGRGEMRSLLYMCSLSAVRFNPILNTVYKRSRVKGMNHHQAAGVVMHKMLRIMYGILKSKKPFDAQIDLQNQEKSKEKQLKKEDNLKKESRVKKEKIYRFQELSTAGPISRRNEQKRKKQIAAQTSKEVNTGLLPADTNI